jgi:LacI family sucrose operon transcriptional repressor
MATITDVAKQAGVSVATVSRVINNRGYLSANTKAKVHAAMDALHYQPNIAARNLHGKATHTVGVILPDIINPFYAELFQTVEQLLFAAHYQTVLCTTNGEPEKEKKYLRLMAANQVDGIISSTHNPDLADYQNPAVPTVAFDRVLSDQIPMVGSDNEAGGRLIGDYVAQHQPKCCLILAGSQEDLAPLSPRIAGMQAALAVTPSAVDQVAVPFDQPAPVRNQLIRQQLAEKDYDAILCTDDLTAITVFESYPADRRPLITGFDGSKFIRQYYPALTTVIQPLEDLCQLAIRLLRNNIDGGKEKAASYQLPVTLHVGQTK